MIAEHKITLTGSVPLNHITTWENKAFSVYGGLTYPSMTLSKSLGGSARITPVSHVMQRDKQAIKTILKGHSGVELLRINSDANQGGEMQFQFIDESKCLEKQNGFMNPVLPDDVKHVLDSDYFLFLPATDFEVALETLHFVKTYSKSTSIFSARGVTSAVTTLGDRVTKFWVDRDLWLPSIDVLVMTPEQAKYSWFAKEYTLEQLEKLEDLDEKQLQEFVGHCFERGVKAVYIVLPGNEGCVAFYLKDDDIQRQSVPSIQVGKSIYITGTVEAFVGGLTFGLIKTNNDYLQASYYANVASAQRTLGLYGNFTSMQETMKIIKSQYNI